MSRRPVEPDDPRIAAWRKAHGIAGGNRPLSKHFGISEAAVAQWVLCPENRVLDVERLSGVSRYQLRPDIFGEFPTDYSGESRYDKLTVAEAIRTYGKRALAETLDLSVEEIEAWEAVPPTLVLRIEALTGISRHRLRPDVFGDPKQEVAA